MLADENSLPLAIVKELAELLGPNEEFDGLVTSCEDRAGMYGDGE